MIKKEMIEKLAGSLAYRLARLVASTNLNMPSAPNASSFAFCASGGAFPAGEFLRIDPFVFLCYQDGCTPSGGFAWRDCADRQGFNICNCDAGTEGFESDPIKPQVCAVGPSCEGYYKEQPELCTPTNPFSAHQCDDQHPFQGCSKVYNGTCKGHTFTCDVPGGKFQCNPQHQCTSSTFTCQNDVACGNLFSCDDADQDCASVPFNCIDDAECLTGGNGFRCTVRFTCYEVHECDVNNCSEQNFHCVDSFN